MRALILQLFFLLLLLPPPAAADSFSSSPAAGSQFPGLSADPEFLPVEEAYRAEIERREDGALRVYWQIAPGYYLYRQAFDFQLQDAAGPATLSIDLPPALERTDEYFGEVAVYYDSADIRLVPSRQVTGVATLQLTSQGCADAGLCYPPRKQTFAIDMASGAVSKASLTAETVQTRARPSGTGTLLYMFLLAAAGGAILNLMPCVFPILSLKVLSFASAGASERHRHAWLYAAGVVCSFLAVAATLIALKQAGAAVGWGFQLQSPGFVVALAYLFIGMGLSLSGLVHFGGRLANVGAGLTSGGGARSSFFTGALAVLVASPCTAPFMGTALGFAMTQPAPLALLVFAALGAGMAAPLLLLSYSTLARQRMPKPGQWMVSLQQALAFPLYLTALWLFWVVGRQTGVDTMASVLLGALLLALALWLWGTGGWRRVAALLALLGAVFFGSWREDSDNPDASSTGDRAAWSEAAVREARLAGRPVFVDFTADWCITCLANERAVLDTTAVQDALKARNVAYLIADWTNYDPEIADFLARMGRSGIPLYLLYPAEPTAAPEVLPQLLRRSHIFAALEAL